MSRMNDSRIYSTGRNTWPGAACLGGLILVVLLVVSGSALAGRVQVPRINLEIDRDKVVVGEPFTLFITVETNSRGDPQVELPRLGVVSRLVRGIK